ncbi:hypothetical protein [Streptacidiphilus sp. MAP12-16]|uniref:hypothetical protein n=1 Tax=Streptacidiphilus sp. MAP12-16 TaxID=3156300 RepID=UPI0035191E25
MSIVIKFFVAPDAEAAAAVAEGGPDGVFESLTFGNFDVEEALIEWEGIFTGRPAARERRATLAVGLARALPAGGPILVLCHS